MQITLNLKFHIFIFIIDIILILFISTQITSSTGYSYLNNFIFFLISKAENTIHSCTNFVYNIFTYCKSLKKQDEYIKILEEKIKILQIQNQLLTKINEENKILREELKLKKKSDYEFILADVIGYDFKSEFLKIIRVNKGSNDGVKKQLPVLVENGVIGIISKTTHNTSEVLLMISTSSALAVSIPDIKANAIAYGTGSPLLKIKFIPISANINEGLQVLTSGTDGIFPAGLPVALTTNSIIKLGLYQEVMAKPIANLYYIKNVIILKSSKLIN